MTLGWDAVGALVALIAGINAIALFITKLIVQREISLYNDKLTEKLEEIVGRIEDDFIKKEVADMQFLHYRQLYDSVSQRVSMLTDLMRKNRQRATR